MQAYSLELIGLLSKVFISLWKNFPQYLVNINHKAYILVCWYIYYGMTQSTISVDGVTIERFNKAKGSFQAQAGHDVTSVEFLNYLLDAYDQSEQISKSVEEISTKEVQA